MSPYLDGWGASGWPRWLQGWGSGGRYVGDVSGDHDDNGRPGDADGTAPARLRVVSGPVAATDAMEPVPEVRVRREFKGLTVADLHREEIASRLPGQVRSALHHLEDGDVAAAEQAMPGQFAKVLTGPGHRPRHSWRLFIIIGIVAVASGSAIASWLTS